MTLAAEAEPKALRLRSASRTDPGRVRTVNEDRLIDRAADGFWAVADGMGGHSAGDVAAARLVDALETVQHRAFGYARVADVVRQAEAVNAALFAQGHCSGGRPSGSTLVALLIQEGHYACVWAGDSRAYLLRGGRLVAISRDHSQVQALVDTGLLSEAGRRHHPQAHLITRAVGAAPMLELDRCFGQVEPGDVFLLCSDGLTGCLDEAEIACGLASGDPQAAADALMRAALSRDAADNITLIVAHADEVPGT